VADLTFGDAVVYNGGEGAAHRLAFVTDVNDGNVINLAAMDGDGNWTVHTDVPRRSPADYEAGGGGGHTWFYRD
jgi:hypothetical protein